ncbi:acyl-CoA thioesterase [Nocardia terrae]|uniref:acyl-CoA thioesterase n=1 Tax=Nocardia terrae TaxID=2675851 RepID=UPI002E2732D7
MVIERVVDWQDTDAAGHYHHSTIIRWVEAAEAALLERYGLRWLFGTIPRVHYEVDYLERLWFGDRAAIELSIAELGRTSVRYEFVVTRISAPQQHSTDQPAVAARGALIAVHAGAGAEPWPAEVTAALAGAKARDAPAAPAH